MNSLLEGPGRLLSAFPFLVPPFLRLKKSGLRIVYYHKVGREDKPYYFQGKGVAIQDLKKQLRFLRKYFTFIDLADALARWETGASLNGYFTITTDDGFRENYTLLAPVLLEHKLSATLFIISNCVDNADLMWRNKLIAITRATTPAQQRELAAACAKHFTVHAPKPGEGLLRWSTRAWEMSWKEDAANWLWKEAGMQELSSFLEEHKPYLSSEQLLELKEAGFGFGLHSQTHPYFSKLTFNEMAQEIQGCANFLKKKLDIDCHLFSYPFGYRAAGEVEQAFISTYSDEVKMLLGIKSRLGNEASPMFWERDLMELQYFQSMARFTLVPFARKLKLINF
ncbi:MAG: polysaccharide deacetylase family protein [Bacteroidetes bacterium]|jgi:peptidoglycan/xylan/chitin deacetylase (PgdA/CDA1 family)|nr:polysaccharide deacetylase family protein [Bacteroidota bacterium]